jgi:hypothetical protein
VLINTQPVGGSITISTASTGGPSVRTVATSGNTSKNKVFGLEKITPATECLLHSGDLRIGMDQAESPLVATIVLCLMLTVSN